MPPVICCAEALLSVGACASARAILTQHAPSNDERARQLLATVDARSVNISAAVAAAVSSEGCGTLKATTDELVYIGPKLVMRELENGKGRGWVTTEHISPGELLLVEVATLPLAPPETAAHPLPLLEAIATRLARHDGDAARMRETLAGVFPRSGEAAMPLARDAHAEPHVAAIAASTGLPLLEVRQLDLKVQRNLMSLKSRVHGELVDHGVGLFPTSALCNHSCDANANWIPIAGGRVLVTRAARAIEAGKEVTYSCTHTSRTTLQIPPSKYHPPHNPPSPCHPPNITLQIPPSSCHPPHTIHLIPHLEHSPLAYSVSGACGPSDVILMCGWQQARPVASCQQSMHARHVQCPYARAYTQHIPGRFHRTLYLMPPMCRYLPANCGASSEAKSATLTRLHLHMRAL